MLVVRFHVLLLFLCFGFSLAENITRCGVDDLTNWMSQALSCPFLYNRTSSCCTTHDECYDDALKGLGEAVCLSKRRSCDSTFCRCIVGIGLPYMPACSALGFLSHCVPTKLVNLHEAGYRLVGGELCTHGDTTSPASATSTTPAPTTRSANVRLLTSCARTPVAVVLYASTENSELDFAGVYPLKEGHELDLNVTVSFTVAGPTTPRSIISVLKLCNSEVTYKTFPIPKRLVRVGPDSASVFTIEYP